MNLVTIPKERIAVLIGPDGKTKEKLEEACRCRININSKEGDVSLAGGDSFALMKAADVVKAVGRGFSPEKALKLANEEWYLFIFDIRDYVGKSQKRVAQMRGRVIGTNGRIRENVERVSDSFISVMGNTVSVIGDIEGIGIAKKAIDMILSGSEYSTVNRFLNSSRRKRILEQFNTIEYRD